MYRIVQVLLVVSITARCSAEDSASAQKLKNEALDILKANCNRQASAEQYADCIFKLEKAQHILDKLNENETALAQEVSSSLFWARKFSDVHVIAALEKIHGGAPEPAAPPVAQKPAPQKPAPDAEAVEAEPDAAIGQAKKSFDAAESYAKSHSSDDYAVALCWFKMANEHAGTDYARKALELARAAQTRFASISTTTTPKAPEVSPETPEGKLLVNADALVTAGKFEESIAVYKESLAKKETADGHRKLAHAYYDRGQQMKDKLLPELAKAEEDVRIAFKNAAVTRRTRLGRSYQSVDPKNPAYQEALRKYNDLAKESYKAAESYDKAASEFKAVLRMAADQRDLDADGHVGLCLGVRGDMNYRLLAKQHLIKFLANYKPMTDIERSLYEFCKTELERLRKLG
jgi:tetratricopeptide (TPR) repeat protein